MQDRPVKQIQYGDIIKLLYPDVVDVVSIISLLGPQKILCLSDTSITFVEDTNTSSSLAVHIEKQISKIKNNDKAPLELIQADCDEFLYSSPQKKFGAHLPQNKDEPRREYHQINNSDMNGMCQGK